MRYIIRYGKKTRLHIQTADRSRMKRGILNGTSVRNLNSSTRLIKNVTFGLVGFCLECPIFSDQESGQLSDKEQSQNLVFEE